MTYSRFASRKPELPPLNMEENPRGRQSPTGENLPPYKLHSYWLGEIRRLGEEAFDKAGSYRKIKQFAQEHKEHAQKLLAHLKPNERDNPIFVQEIEEQIRQEDEAIAICDKYIAVWDAQTGPVQPVEIRHAGTPTKKTQRRRPY